MECREQVCEWGPNFERAPWVWPRGGGVPGQRRARTEGACRVARCCSWPGSPWSWLATLARWFNGASRLAARCRKEGAPDRIQGTGGPECERVSVQGRPREEEGPIWKCAVARRARCCVGCCGGARCVCVCGATCERP
eukprot:1271661-Pyramimonas_sp.AAC.1